MPPHSSRLLRRCSLSLSLLARPAYIPARPYCKISRDASFVAAILGREASCSCIDPSAVFMSWTLEVTSCFLMRSRPLNFTVLPPVAPPCYSGTVYIAIASPFQIGHCRAVVVVAAAVASVQFSSASISTTRPSSLLLKYRSYRPTNTQGVKSSKNNQPQCPQSIRR